MHKSMLSLVAVFVLAGSVFAGPQLAQDEGVRTSRVAPDLRNTTAGWNLVSKVDGTLVSVPYQGKTLTVLGSDEHFVNDKEQMKAYLYSRKDASGKSEEFAMIYGTDNVARGAIKVNGKWHLSKELYFDNGVGNPNGKVRAELVFSEKETDKPVQVRFVLETVDGYKEVVSDLQ